jgi:sulfur relay protein TusB/DsrH
MSMGLFVSDLRFNEETLQRLEDSKLGVFLVENGVYHAVLKEDGKSSPILDKAGANFYVLTEDLETRGFTGDDVDDRAKVINMGELVDLIMGDYEKLGWL